MRRTPWFICVVVGCTPSARPPPPTWSLPIDVSPRGSQLRAALRSDGELVIAARGVGIGGSDTVGAHLVRVSPAGAVTNASAFDVDDTVQPFGVKVDDAGRATVVLGYPDQDSEIVAFDAADRPRWRKRVLHSFLNFMVPFDVGRAGSVFVGQMDHGGSSSMRAINEDGSDQWTVNWEPRPVFFVAALDNGTIAVTGGQTMELDATDGHIVGPSPLGGQTTFRQTRHDGTTAARDDHIEHLDDIVLFDPSGAERWRRSGINIGLCPSPAKCLDPPLGWSEHVLLTPDDRVIVNTDVTSITVLAAGNGDTLTTVDHGDSPALFAADAEGYVVLERTADGGTTLSRYRYSR